MKIVGFAQLRNELKNGNLENWFKSMVGCDFIYIYDQASDDGSFDYYRQFENTVVIRSEKNDFEHELQCKDVLLKQLLKDHPDTDWIFWMDGDTVLDGRLLRNNCNDFKKLCAVADSKNAEGISLGHYNLWRSDLFYRLDQGYHGLHGNVCAFWKNNKKLQFVNEAGLHGQQYPSGIVGFLRSSVSLIHRGFATDQQIINKYEIYKARGQSGWALDRFFIESDMIVDVVPKELFPDWYSLKDISCPIQKKRLKTIYEERSK